MKKTLFALALATCVAGAVEVKFAWDYSDGVSRLSGFRFYDAAGQVTNRIDVPPVLECAAELSPGEHVVWVTAVSLTGIESLPSDTLTIFVPPRPIKFVVVP